MMTGINIIKTLSGTFRNGRPAVPYLLRGRQKGRYQVQYRLYHDR